MLWVGVGTIQLQGAFAENGSAAALKSNRKRKESALSPMAMPRQTRRREHGRRYDGEIAEDPHQGRQWTPTQGERQ